MCPLPFPARWENLRISCKFLVLSAAVMVELVLCKKQCRGHLTLLHKAAALMELQKVYTCSVNQNPVCRGPPRSCYIPLCRGLLLHTFGANACRRYALQKNLVAKVLVAGREILLQTYVAESPRKPVTNPVFLIHSHISKAFLRSSQGNRAAGLDPMPT